MQIPLKLAANLWKALKSEISYTIELSLNDIELERKSPMESFPSINLQSVAGWQYACLSQNTA